MRETNMLETAEERSRRENEERLLRENDELKRQIQALQSPAPPAAHAAVPAKAWQPSRYTIWSIVLGLVVLVIVAFLAGYIPLNRQKTLIDSEALEREQALPRVAVLQVSRSSQNSELELPGNIQAVTEAPILARADGYVKRRLVDIGDRVKAGQIVAEIEAPELDEQVNQSLAALEQAKASLDQALANREQGKANVELARVTAERWGNLVTRGVVSKQDNDLYQTQYRSQLSGVRALDRAVSAQSSNVAAAEANLARLQRMGSYRTVRAPFAGVITQRNVDIGALVSTGSTLLYRIAQTDTLRTYVNVPQSSASTIRPGQLALLRVANLPGRTFPGAVARTASSLDPTSRTMLVEVHVPNKEGALLPGMYAQVNLSSKRENPPLVVPSDALVVHSEGTLVAVLRPDHSVHLQKIVIGRDYGDRLEVVDGLHEGDIIIPNPGDLAREGLKVDPVAKE
ncbi:MAG TPA: efflux RND transporter periplasmic adaptor subunit [Bryobacteraceae bacterium]|nr:efflux RND transporter periplasmic adaptor subunit [Bryobacteraceae bacterium]